MRRSNRVKRLWNAEYLGVKQYGWVHCLSILDSYAYRCLAYRIWCIQFHQAWMGYEFVLKQWACESCRAGSSNNHHRCAYCNFSSHAMQAKAEHWTYTECLTFNYHSRQCPMLFTVSTLFSFSFKFPFSYTISLFLSELPHVELEPCCSPDHPYTHPHSVYPAALISLSTCEMSSDSTFGHTSCSSGSLSSNLSFGAWSMHALYSP